MTADTTAAAAKRTTFLWVLAFFVGMFGTPMLLSATDVVPAPWGMAVMVLPMLLLIPMVRSAERMQAATGCASLVARRYNRRMLAASFAYVVGLGVALTLFQAQDVAKPVAAALSLLPTLPVLAMIWAMARYVIEESDEYLRARTVNAALIATGVLLGVATFWGFLTTFGVTPDIPTWAAVPVWCIGLAIGQLAAKVRGS